MRKKLARYGIVAVLVAVGASTLAPAETRSAVVADGERSAKTADSSSQGTLTIQRLLQGRLGWTRQLARALRFLDLPPVPPNNGTNTIIDEPDPAGYNGDPAPEAGDQEEEAPADLTDQNGFDPHQGIGMGN